MFFPLVIVGGFLLVFGFLTFVIDAFRIHWGWGVASIFLVPLGNLVCLIKHWAKTRRGFLLTLLALPFLIGAYFVMPKGAPKDAAGKPAESKDPFYNMMQKARATVDKVQDSRKEVGKPTTAPVASATAVPLASAEVAPMPAATPVRSLSERLAKNRADFKRLEKEFAALEAKRKALPKNSSPQIAAFNLEAKDYTNKLASIRSEQAVLLEMQNIGRK